MVGGVLAGGRFDDHQVVNMAVEAVGDSLGVGASRVVAVGDDDHLGRPVEQPGVLVLPFGFLARFARPARVAGGGLACLAEGFDVFLSLGHEDGLPGRHRGEHLGQPVQDLAGGAETIDPAAVAVRTALREGLVAAADHLEEQLAGLVGVVVDGDDLRSPAGPFGWEQVCRGETEGARTASRVQPA